MKIKILFILLFNYNTHSVSQECDSCNSNENMSNDMLFNNKCYPNLGDIPILNRKIFRGSRVNIREHAYVVSIRRELVHYLTGTLISRNVVLTIAHPIYNVPINELGVVVGENYSDRGTTLLTVIFVLVHQHFDPYTLIGDIAILRMYEDVVYRSNVKAISLMYTLSKVSGTAMVTGWGRCDFTGKELCLPRSSKYFPDEKIDPMLRSISFFINSSNYYCDGYERQETPLREGMLCAGQAREENAVAPCLAVPGAPLVVNSKLTGILSWGFGCGYLNDLPLIYTNIQHYVKWLARNMQVINKITKENTTALFLATKSYTLLRWLNETRMNKSVEHEHTKQLQQADIDILLAELQGEEYDIRDFAYNGRHRATKREMFEDLKLLHKNDSKVYPKFQIKTLPFLDNSSLDVDYYFDNF